MISKDKIMDEIEKMENWPMTPDNMSTLAAMLYVKDHLDDEDDEEDYGGYKKQHKQQGRGKGENREGVSYDPYAAQRGHARGGGKGGGDEDMEKMFRKFMEQFSER